MHDVPILHTDEEMTYPYYEKYYNVHTINVNVVPEKYFEPVDKITEEPPVDPNSTLEDTCIVARNNGGGYVNYSSPRIAPVLNVGGEFIGVAKDGTEEVPGSPDVTKEKPLVVVVGCPGLGRVRSAALDGKPETILILN